MKLTISTVSLPPLAVYLTSASGFRREPGLVRSQSGWQPPHDVFRGQDIFGGTRPHVATAGAELLWAAVGVHPPGLEDCTAVLRELAGAKTTPAPQGTLIAIYQHLDRLVREAKRPAPNHLVSLPLWTDQGWRLKRPLYAALDYPLEQALAEKGLPVWRPPCRPGELRDLLFALDVQIVDEGAVEPIAPDAAALVLGSEFLDDFREAVDHLNDRLVERNYELHSQLGIDWHDLRQADVAVSGVLEQRVALPGRKAVTVPTEAFFLKEPQTLCVRSEQALAAADGAGNAVASLFERAEDRDYLALAWTSAWTAAIAGERAVGIEVAPAEEDGDPLGDWQKDPRRPTKPGSMQRNSVRAKEKGAGSKPPPAKKQPQRLASFESIIAQLPDGQYSSGSNGKPNGKPRKRSSTKLRPPRKTGGVSHNKPPSGGKEYNDHDVEDMGLRVLDDRMWEWFGLNLSDQHKFKLVGSDAVDEFAGFWVELKAHAGELSDSETLTAAEGKRAYLNGKRYLLAVVSGLAEGAKPDVRIFADPIRTLDLCFDRSIRLSGIKSHSGLKKISLSESSGRGRRRRKA